MTFSPVPKPEPREQKVRKYLSRSTKALKRSPIKATGRPMRKRNETRIARKAKAYRAVIASDFHKQLRYRAFQRSGGFCECAQCVTLRLSDNAGVGLDGLWIVNDILLATTEIDCYFTVRGAAAYKRFRSKDGEMHHDSYKFFGDENPAELAHVRWVHKACHRRIESEHGTRRRFLTGR